MKKNIIIRDVKETDLSQVIALNESALPHVNRVGEHALQWFMKRAAYFRVAVQGQEVVGFMIGLTSDVAYKSPNFIWFRKHHPKALYVDRIVVSEDSRRLGVATRLYADIEFSASEWYMPKIACEVNTLPPNEVSLTFHETIGFSETGTQSYHGGKKAVAYLIKPVPRAIAACA